MFILRIIGIPKLLEKSAFRLERKLPRIDDSRLRKLVRINPIRTNLRSSIIGALAKPKNRFFQLFGYILIFCTTAIQADSSKETVEAIAKIADVEINGTRSWDIQVHNPNLYDRILKRGSLGLGNAYMEKWWDCEALDECMFRILRADLEHQLHPSWAMKWSILKARLFNLQNKKKSLEVIEQHYQLGNDLFENMLDSTMAYSCGYWRYAKTLEEAQIAKYDLICKKLELHQGMRILDIGCGWGGFAKYAAEKYQVNVVGITLSENQAEYARKVCEGLPVEILVKDYRDIKGQFDRIIEIGMFEHVGVKNYRSFMEIVHHLLKDDGLLMLHTIGSNTTSGGTDPWIDQYIFPNGHLPSIAQVGKAIEGLFVMEDWHNFSTDYDKTLMAWYANFEKNWDKIRMNYPDPFFRMWKYYLLTCAGAFRARNIQLWQVVLAKNGVIGGYDSIR
jgi:cyclopropane-fatty-acyl-phospholipid synthase